MKASRVALHPEQASRKRQQERAGPIIPDLGRAAGLGLGRGWAGLGPRLGEETAGRGRGRAALAWAVRQGTPLSRYHGRPRERCTESAFPGKETSTLIFPERPACH